MAETERVINDLNVVKITLCNQKMLLTPEVRVRIGQVITSAIALLKEQQETIELQGSLLTLAHAAMNQKRKKDKD